MLQAISVREVFAVKHIFIINPSAGKSDSRQRVYAMADTLRTRHGLDVQCMLTISAGHAEALARSLAESGKAVRLYACGGDGTANAVANGIAGYANAAMTCIPAGTGNDFLKNFGEDYKKFLDAEQLWNGDVQPLDLIDCNGRCCLTIACSGIDARIAESVHRFGSNPLLSGRGSYLASVAANCLFTSISQHLTVWLDDERIEDDFALISVCNGRYYGGGSTPVPEARMNDGVLNTVLVRRLSKLRIAQFFPAYSAGRHERLPEELVRLSTAKLIRIHSDKDDIVTCLDGECSHARDVTLRLADRKLNFFGPDGCDPNATAAPKHKDPARSAL